MRPNGRQGKRSLSGGSADKEDRMRRRLTPLHRKELERNRERRFDEAVFGCACLIWAFTLMHLLGAAF